MLRRPLDCVDDFLQVLGSAELSSFSHLFSLLGCQVLPRDAGFPFAGVLQLLQAFSPPHVKRSNPAALTPAGIERWNADFTPLPIDPGFTQMLDFL